jgi:drug/metabolite transporter (DMT)-like permease
MRARAHFALMSPATLGALWMLLAACLLATLSLLVRHVAGTLHPFEIAFFRNFFQLLLMVPWVFAVGVRAVHTRRIWAHVRRSAFGIVAMLMWFWVITQMPIGEATAISFSAPLFTTAGAALFLGERVGPRRWVATAAGFIGVLMIIRPGVTAVNLPEILALATAVFIAGAMLSNKSLARTESPNAMVLWMGVFMSIFSLPAALGVWAWPMGWTWTWLVGLGFVATAAHLAINRAFASADASFIAPFGFAQIPFVTVVGYFVFAELPDAWSLSGALVIMVSGVYTAYREAKVSRVVAAQALSGVAAVGYEK